MDQSRRAQCNCASKKGSVYLAIIMKPNVDLLPFRLLPVFIGLSIYTTIEGRARVKRALRATFEALRFTTPDGVVDGTAVTVVGVKGSGSF